MIYLSTFHLSDRKLKNPNVYPYSVFRNKYIEPFVFEPITVLYGNNGSGKSTVLNIIADKLQLKGREHAISDSYGIVNYFDEFVSECSSELETYRLPEESMYLKSEDVLYEIKKAQQSEVLSEGMVYDLMKEGKGLKEARDFVSSPKGGVIKDNLLFNSEKHSNGETAMMFFEEHLQMDALYLLDEPEVSLSPASQVELAKKINELTRLLGCQFIIATHSPFLLGTLNAKIYNLDTTDYDVMPWYKLENVRYFYEFFRKHESKFE